MRYDGWVLVLSPLLMAQGFHSIPYKERLGGQKKTLVLHENLEACCGNWKHWITRSFLRTRNALQSSTIWNWITGLCLEIWKREVSISDNIGVGQSGCRVMRFGPSVGAWELEGLLWFVTTSCCTFRLSSLVIHCQDPMVTVCRWSVKFFLPESRSRPIQLVALSGVHRSEDGRGLTALASQGRNQRWETFSAGSE